MRGSDYGADEGYGNEIKFFWKKQLLFRKGVAFSLAFKRGRAEKSFLLCGSFGA